MGKLRQPYNLVQFRDNEYPETPMEICIDNWRYIREDFFQGKSDIGRGCYILDTDLYFIPGVVFEQIEHVSNTQETLEVYFFRAALGSSWCHRCHGAGKLSWIDNATGGNNRPNNPMSLQFAKQFVRDRDILMSYTREWGGTHGTLYLAPTIVNEGEITCRECHGTGLWLNATVHLFQGFPRIRSSITYKKGRPLYPWEASHGSIFQSTTATTK